MTQNSKQTTQRRNGTMGLEHIPLSSNIQSKKLNKIQKKNIYIKTKQKEKIKKYKKTKKNKQNKK
jgi:hypothetical protein